MVARLDHLDGLRGVAALVVMGGHTALVVTASQVYDPREPALWASNAAVIVFFVLSGFVLARMMAGARPSLPRYYAARLARLYLPLWAALAVAVIAHALFWTTAADEARSLWLQVHLHEMSVGGGLREATVVFREDTFTYASAFWSLKWEVVFSLLLPGMVAAAMRWRQAGLLIAVACAALILSALSPWTHYLSVFMLGVLTAVHREPLAAWFAQRSSLVLAAVWVLVVALLSAGEWAPQSGSAVGGQAPAAVAAGAAGLVALLAQREHPGRLMGSRAARWLGSRSFSLYLVHEIVVVSLGLAVPRDATVAMLAAFVVVTVVGSLVLAEAFYRTIERPSHQLARRALRRQEPATWLAPPSAATAPHGIA